MMSHNSLTKNCLPKMSQYHTAFDDSVSFQNFLICQNWNLKNTQERIFCILSNMPFLSCTIVNFVKDQIAAKKSKFTMNNIVFLHANIIIYNTAILKRLFSKMAFCDLMSIFNDN